MGGTGPNPHYSDRDKTEKPFVSDQPVIAPRAGDLNCPDLKDVNLSAVFSDFARDVSSREGGKDPAGLAARLASLLGVMNAESGFESTDVMDMSSKEAKLKLQDFSALKISGLEVDTKTNFGLAQMSVDRFGLHPIDSLNALGRVTGNAVAQGATRPTADGNYFRAARDQYGKFSSSVASIKERASGPLGALRYSNPRYLGWRGPPQV